MYRKPTAHAHAPTHAPLLPLQAKLPPDSTALIKVPAGTSLDGVMQAVEAGDMAKAMQELELLLGDDMPVSALRALPQARILSWTAPQY